MKSSTGLKLTLMTGAAAAGLSFCSAPQKSFSNVAECVGAGNTEALCRGAYEAALAEHVQSAPTFASLQDCRANVDVDQCISTLKRDSNGTVSNVIVPMMAGYMLGQNVRDERENQGSTGGGSGRYFYGGRSYGGAPLYQSRRNPGNYWTAPELRTSTFPSSRPNVRTATVSRGGFGGHSSFGGG
ncbi:DUF1190 domain-containing protein [Microvirga mediterraneensis]|uniref:DUF1190 domain-containing protein n=1 Tax=Microvirga mediterraneensis TaxID=2754695 RepID=A0A838BRA4_9HYPH|nr:DUF1190 domain-containing protein [Microvirga mediterraneensis]MBA1157880.1 DUF1190 domain-containing protein [Microvirga mediterraneensis]